MRGIQLTSFKDGRHCLAYYRDGKRRRETFAKLREAQRRKNEVERLMGRGIKVPEDSKIAADEAAHYAVRRLAESGIDKPVSSVVDEYIEAAKHLKEGETIVQACKVYASNQDKIIPISTGDLVNDYKRYLIGQKVGQTHLEKTIKIYLKRFAADMPQTISSITLKDLQEWRSSFTSGPRTVNNYCNAVKALFNYAQDHGHLRKDRKNEASRLKDIEEPATEPNPFTIEEMALLLTGADKKSLPFIILGAFAGIRTAEQKRLHWEKHVRWDTGYFDLTGNVTKKKLRRLVPILPVVSQWLEPYKGRSGPIITAVHPERPPTALLRIAGLEWRHNGLRDAFGSNRAAVVKNLNQVAMEMGNSPDMVVESYREVVTQEQAERFWNLTPSEAKKLNKGAEDQTD